MSVEEPVPCAFAEGFRGDLVSSGDPGYDDARQLFNGMIDKHPAVIARCADVADVISAVDYARVNGLELPYAGVDTTVRGLAAAMTALSSISGT